MIVDGCGCWGEGGGPMLVYRRWCRLDAVDEDYLEQLMILLQQMIVYTWH